MENVVMQSRDIDAYVTVVGTEPIEELRRLAEPLRGRRVVHINATPVGGGVAEILKSEIPLLQSLGIDAEWRTISGAPEFFEVTKKIHNALQSDPRGLSNADWNIYDRYLKLNGEMLSDGIDVVVVHDPQPMGLPCYARDISARWIWRLHVDSSTPNQDVWARLRSNLDAYDAAVFTLPAFVPPGVAEEKCWIIAPAIDPLLPKNQPLAYDRALRTLQRIGLDPGRPLVAQVARLDVWKDPWGVIDAFRELRQDVPGVQLALLGVIEALDDPEAFDVYQQVVDYAGGDPDIHIFVDPEQIGQTEVSAVQTLAQVIFQKSKREGFGLSVTEALWKATPVIGGRAGGIPLQIEDGVGGFLVDDAEEAAARSRCLLQDPPAARVLGARGREHVRENFLTTRLIADELRLYSAVLGAG